MSGTTVRVQSSPQDRASHAVLRRRFLRVWMGGYLPIAVGVVALVFVVYELYVTSWVTEAEQRELTSALELSWAQAESSPAPENVRGEEGDGILRLHAPELGPDLAFTVLEGTRADILASGPGHYTDSALPGRPGNFALAGHRVTHGAPFNKLDTLRSCDALVVEDRLDWFVYRVLPMSDEVQGWAAGRGAEANCRGVTPLGSPYTQVHGRTIVDPDDRSVIAAVPGLPTAAPEASLITLTTCEPEYSARQRLILHGVLVATYPKSDGRPAELLEG